MQKKIIAELLDIYHGRAEAPSINQWLYRKGWLKRLFHIKTQGIADLEAFFERNEMKALLPEGEITEVNLKELLYLMEARNNRIRETDRDYTKKPDKRTNCIYQRLHDLLLFDTLFEKESILPSVEYCMQVLFAHYANLVLWEIEKRALAGETFDTSSGAILFSSQLAKALSTGEAHDFNFSQFTTESQESENTKVLQFENQQIEVSFQFTDGQLSTVKIMQAKIALKKNLQDHLKWLKLSSYLGDSEASNELADYYEKLQNSSFIYNALDGIRSWRYRRIARQQNSPNTNSGDYAEELMEYAQQQDINALTKNNIETHELTQCIITLREATEGVSEATRATTDDIVGVTVTITHETERLKTTTQQVEDETLEKLNELSKVTGELVRKKDELETVLRFQQSEGSGSPVVYESEQLTLLSKELILAQEEIVTIKQQLMDYVKAFNQLFQENEANKKIRKECIELVKKYEKILKEKLSESIQSTPLASGQSGAQPYNPQFWFSQNKPTIKRSTSCPSLVINC